jgi:hypothetical protein
MGRGRGVAVGVGPGVEVGVWVGSSVGVWVGVGVNVGEGASVGVGVEGSTGGKSTTSTGWFASGAAGASDSPTTINVIAAGTSATLSVNATMFLEDAPVDDTGEEYRSEAHLSSNTWRWIVATPVIALCLIGLTILAIAVQPDVRRSPPLWMDTFDEAGDSWTLTPADGSLGDGRLRLHPARSDRPSLALHALVAADFVAETHARVSSDSTDDGYGIVIGNGDEWTAFLVSSDGYIGVMRYADDEWRDVLPWRQWPHVRRGGATNTLRIECRVTTCAFFVNDEVSAPVEVAQRREIIGLIAWRYAANALTVEFDDMRVWDN